MPSHKKVALTSIKSLTFYADQQTSARRTEPIPQLTCVGKACSLYQPEVVQCINMGDDGLGGVQWRCDTDLPSSLRLGRTDVSCEGWAKAGDKNVLQGSCGLTYDLHRVNKGLEYGEEPLMPSTSSFDRLIQRAFNYVFLAILSVILYSIVRSLIARFWPSRTPPHISRLLPFLPGPGPDGGGGGGGHGGGGAGGGGGGPGFNPGSGGGPPPYSKFPQAQTQAQAQAPQPHTSTTANGQTQADAQAQAGGPWNPGFWTGLAAGGAGAYLMNRRANGDPTLRNRPQEMYARRFDDEDVWDSNRGAGSMFGRRGESSSSGSGLGEVRRATGFGGSSTR